MKIVIVIGIVLLVAYSIHFGFGSGRGPGTDKPSDPPTSAVKPYTDMKTERDYIIVIKGADYYHDGRQQSLDQLLGGVKTWVDENEGPVTVTQDQHDKAQSGAVRDLRRALYDAKIAYKEDF